MNLRQLANLLLSIAQPIAGYWIFGRDVPFDQFAASFGGRPLIEPAGYAFTIWGLIYAGTIAYGIYQALPSQRDNPLFGRIGWFTAGAFLGTVAWLFAARAGMIWLAFLVIAAMLGLLVPAYRAILAARPGFSAWQRAIVLYPFGLFAGWLSVATVANLAAALKYGGWMSGNVELTVTIVLITLAGAVGSVVAFMSRGELGYTAAVVWALVAILVADLVRLPWSAITPVAGAFAGTALGAALAGRLQGDTPWDTLRPAASK